MNLLVFSRGIQGDALKGNVEHRLEAEAWRMGGGQEGEAERLRFGNVGFVCDSCDFGGLWKQASS